MKRRSFLRKAAEAGIIISSFPIKSLGAIADDAVKITILHTNDVHSRMDPFPAGSGKLEGFGGVARRATLINRIRSSNKHVLLLDAGDLLQGTPYFNLFKGEVEFQAMNAMKYDVATIGNHDFDAGVEQLATNTKNANFQFVNVNYDFRNTPMNGLVIPYVIKQVEHIKIGIFGVGIALEGLVPKAWYGETRYLDPIYHASTTALRLRKEEKCDYVICISHLGYKGRSLDINDVILAQSTANIDLIIGGHTHTFLDMPDARRNIQGQPVLINQVGWAGIRLGRLDVTISPRQNNRIESRSLWVNELERLDIE